MSAFVFLLTRSFVNTVKELFKKPAALIAYIIIGIFFIGSSILSTLGSSQGGSYLDESAIKAIFCGYTAFLFFIVLFSSLEGASFFRMADVNFLFTAPVRAGNILTYGFVKQLFVNILVMFFLALQYPNWKRMAGLKDGAGWILMLAYLLLITLSSVLGMALYSFISRRPGGKQWARRLLLLGTVLFFIPIFVELVKTRDILQSLLSWLSGDAVGYIPFIGWFRELLMGTVTGLTPGVLYNGLLILISLLILFIYLYRMDTEFFEDVLAGTELRESMLRSMREGKSATVPSIRRYRKVQFEFTMEGSWAIFQKKMLENKKTGIGLVGIRTIVMLAIALVVSFTVPLNNVDFFSILLGASCYMMLIFTIIYAWEGELSNHYIYLIPAEPFKKMIAATLPENLKVAVEGVLIFGIVGAVTGIPILIILSAILAYITFNAVLVYFDVLIRRIFGKVHTNVLRIFLRVFLLMLIIAVVVAPTIILIVITKNHALGFFAAGLINTLLALLFMVFGVELFRNPEL